MTPTQNNWEKSGSRRVKYGGGAGREFEQSCRRLEKQTSIYINH